MDTIIDILDWLNKHQGVANWIVAAVAIVALWYAIKEFVIKRRPYIDVEIEVMENRDKERGGWLFYAKLLNKGTYPGVIKDIQTVIRVGDEVYPNEITNKFFIAPGESKKTALIGSIYRQGVEKILGHEYRSNRCEIEIEIQSGEIDTEKLKYSTKATYQVDVRGERPVITLIEEVLT